MLKYDAISNPSTWVSAIKRPTRLRRLAGSGSGAHNEARNVGTEATIFPAVFSAINGELE